MSVQYPSLMIEITQSEEVTFITNTFKYIVHVLKI